MCVCVREYVRDKLFNIHIRSTITNSLSKSKVGQEKKKFLFSLFFKRKMTNDDNDDETLETHMNQR